MISHPPLLQIKNLHKSFGGIVALAGLSFNLQAGQIKAVIGPNGAGKTTIFNLITGIYGFRDGEILLGQTRLKGLKPHQIAKLGMTRTFQNVQIFGNMTVLENVMVGCHPRTKSEMIASAFRFPSALLEESAIKAKSMEILKFVELDSKAHLSSQSLPFGQQRLLEIARALATEPKVLLLDEPAAGLNASETGELAQLIYKIREKGITILLVEHDMNLVMEIAEEIVVLDYGEKIAEGTPEAIQNDQRVITAYLGE